MKRVSVRKRKGKEKQKTNSTSQALVLFGGNGIDIRQLCTILCNEMGIKV